MASILYVATDEGVVTLKSEDGHNWKQEHHGLKDWADSRSRGFAKCAEQSFCRDPRRRRLGQRRFWRDAGKSPAMANAVRAKCVA